MKTIQQLLALYDNPYYTFTKEEKEVIDNFLEKKRAKESAKSQKKNSPKSNDKTPVTVKNIVHKADTYPPVASDDAL